MTVDLGRDQMRCLQGMRRSCPEECITVEREVISDKIEGKVEIIKDNCCTCTWCSRNCPTEAITVEKIFEGDIEFHAEKCPGGCSTCAEICPANAIYLPTAKPAADMKGVDENRPLLSTRITVSCVVPVSMHAPVKISSSCREPVSA